MTAPPSSQNFNTQVASNPSQQPRRLSRVFLHPMLQQHLDTHPQPRQTRPTPPTSPTSTFSSPHPSPTGTNGDASGETK
ncbi:hypothetical protein ACHAQA_007131 [Verticillium albo-atrum]